MFFDADDDEMDLGKSYLAYLSLFLDCCTRISKNHDSIGDLHLGDKSGHPCQPLANEPEKQQYSTRPPDWNEPGRYDPRLAEVQEKWDECKNRMMDIPTIDGVPVPPFPDPWLPWIASMACGFKFFLLFLQYCPTSVWNFCGDRKGGHMSPMAAMRADGSLRAATWNLLLLAYGQYYWHMAKANLISFVLKYKGKISDIYTTENYRELMAIYGEFLKFWLSKIDHVVICSRGALKNLQKMVGDEMLQQLLEDGVIISAATDSIVTHAHPEKKLNPIYHDNGLEHWCKLFDEITTN